MSEDIHVKRDLSVNRSGWVMLWSSIYYDLLWKYDVLVCVTLSNCKKTPVANENFEEPETNDHHVCVCVFMCWLFHIPYVYGKCNQTYIMHGKHFFGTYSLKTCTLVGANDFSHDFGEDKRDDRPLALFEWRHTSREAAARSMSSRKTTQNHVACANSAYHWWFTCNCNHIWLGILLVYTRKYMMHFLRTYVSL